jgi:AraC-like DNA-binding protein
MMQRTTSSTWMRGVAQTLAAQGLDAAALFAQAGLDLAGLDDADRRWPTDAVSRLWQLAAQRCGNPALALLGPPLQAPAHYGVVGYAMMSSPQLRTALDRLVRYLRLVSDAASISLLAQAGGHCIRLDLYGGALPVPRQRYEYGLLTLLAFCRWLGGRELRPLWACFSASAPADEQPYRGAFQCALRFDAGFNGLCIADDDLAAALPTGLPALAELHDDVARRGLDRLQHPRTSHRAQEVIAKRLQDGEPQRAAIAAALGLGDSTFKRQLAREGTSFSALVDATRRELAQRYLGQKQVSLTQIVYLLGYADQSNFFRACLRWFGRSPGEYRLSGGTAPGAALPAPLRRVS